MCPKGKKNISIWKTELTEFERSFLNYIYDHWDRTGNWPRSIDVALHFDDYDEEYYKASNNLGRDFIEVGYPGQKQDVSSLTIFGIVLCDNTEKYIEIFIKIIKILVEEYKKNPDKKFHWIDIKDHLNLDDSYASKIFHLIGRSALSNIPVIS